MSANPPLRKPRHADGRLMTEDEIRGLDGRELDLQVHHCLIDSDPIWLAPQMAGNGTLAAALPSRLSRATLTWPYSAGATSPGRMRPANPTARSGRS